MTRGLPWWATDGVTPRRWILALTGALVLAMAACGPLEGQAAPVAGESPGPEPSTDVPAAGLRLGYTYHRPDGNRLVGGQGPFPGGARLDIPLRGSPGWLVGASLGDQTVWWW